MRLMGSGSGYLWIGVIILLLQSLSLSHATYTQAPVKGWGSSIHVFTDLNDAVAHSCSSVEGWLPGRTEEHVSGPWKMRFWCNTPDPSDPSGFSEQEIGLVFWKEACQAGYSPQWQDGGLQGTEIAQCNSVSVVPAGQKEVCQESACTNPIYVSSQRKVQREVDYRGTGNYPLMFVRTYSSGSPGQLGEPASIVGIERWSHQYDRRLFGNLMGTTLRAATRYTFIGNTITPEPLMIGSAYSGGDSVGGVNAQRPDGSTIFFPNLTADPNQRVSLVPSALPDGSSGYTLTLGNDKQELYDATGRLVALRLRSGEMHSLSYNGDGQLIAVTDDYGSH